jgi:hypothetical protein
MSAVLCLLLSRGELGYTFSLIVNRELYGFAKKHGVRIHCNVDFCVLNIEFCLQVKPAQD